MSFLQTVRPRTKLLVGALLALLPTACNTPLGETLRSGGGGPVHDETEYLLPGDNLEADPPVDIALAPLRNQSENAEVPVEELREAFYGGLVDRLYSPLELAYVDAHWAESSFAGAPPPDAVLTVTITEWDERRLVSTGTLDAAAELRLFDGASTAGTPLWAVSLKRRLDVSPRESATKLSRKLLPLAIEAFSREALALLPERDPLTGRL